MPSGAALPQEPSVRPALKGITTRIPVKGFHITGIKAFPEDELLALVKDSIGKDLTLDELNGLALRITHYYRHHGYLLARAYIPAQDIKNGIIEITVLEVRLGQLHLNNRSTMTDSTVNGHLAHLQGATVHAAPLERELLLLNDLPGIEVRSTLHPGASVGTADLDVTVNDTRRVTGSVDADNFGNRYTGDLRAGLTLTLNSPTGHGDLLTLRGLTAGNGMDYGRLAYQLPVGSQGAKVGVAYSGMRYELGEDFATLKAYGNAQISSLYLLHPLRRSLESNLNLQLSYDHKALEDRIDTAATLSNKTLDVWTLGFSGDHLDQWGGGGLFNWNAGLTSGDLAMDSTSAALDQAATGHHTQGTYQKLTYSLGRLQRLTDAFTLYSALSGQWASKNLDTSEKLSLGGAYGVRAYPQGEASGDDVWLATVELRYTLPQTPNVQLMGFIDGGNSRLNHSPLATDTNNNRNLAGMGVGLAWSKPADFTLRTYLAWRAGSLPASDVDRTPRAWVQGVKYF